MIRKLKRLLSVVLAVSIVGASVVVGFSYTTINITENHFLYNYLVGNNRLSIPLKPSSSSFLNRINDSSWQKVYLFYTNSITVCCIKSSRFKFMTDTVRTSVGDTQTSYEKYQLYLNADSNTYRVSSPTTTTSLTVISSQSSSYPLVYIPGKTGLNYHDSTSVLNVSGVTFSEYVPPTPKSHTLTVNYLYTADSPAADSVTQSLASGTEYSIPSPEVEGYTPDIPLVSGTMPDEDLTINVFYSRAFYPLTIKYQYADGRKALDDISFQYPLGFVYDVPSPEIEGYQADKSTIAGEMPGVALEEIVTYTAIPYTLTVHYQHLDGTQAAPSYQEQLVIGSNYTVVSPAIEGYHPNQTMVTGVMPARDVVSTVTYRADSGGSGGPDPVGPGEGGDSGGGDSGEGGDGSGDDPFIPSLPPFSGNDPFVISGVPGYSGYDPFKISGPPAYSGYNPFVVPRIPSFSGYDPFAMPDKGGSD